MSMYLELWRVSIIRYWDSNFHIIGRAFSFELCLGFDHVFNSRSSIIFDNCFDPNEGLDGCLETVTHQFEITVWRNEANSTIILEARETNTLVEFDILHFDSFGRAR